MGNRVRLSNDLIKKVTYESEGGKPNANSRIMVYDDQVRGFAIRLYPSGLKAFVLRYPNPDKPRSYRTITLGDWPILNATRARNKALDLWRIVLDGGNPAEEKRSNETFRDFSNRYMDEYAKPRKKTWKKDNYRMEKHLLPAFGNRRLSGITRAEVVALHNRIGEAAPIEANRVIQLLRGIIAIAIEWGVLPRGFENPVSGIRQFKESKRNRVFSQDEFNKLLTAAETEVVEGDRWFGLYLRLMFFTLSRKSELLSLKKSDIDYEAGTITFRHTKADRVLVLGVPPEALDVARQAEAKTSPETPWLWPAPRGDAHRTNIAKVWRNVVTKSGVQDAHLHDVRRTAATWLSASGSGQFEIQRVLNHSDVGATAHYVHLSAADTRSTLSRLPGMLGGK